MNIEELCEYCLSKQAVEETLPFGPQTLVFRVGNKLFLLVGLDQVDQLSFNVKCNPERAIELREEYAQTVFPGYHMNKKHWNTIFANRELSDDVLKQLIDDSYQLVVESLPKNIRQQLI